MDSVVDPETGEEFVWRFPFAYGVRPSQVTREAWVQVADHYDPRSLLSLWEWTAHQVRLHGQQGRACEDVVRRASLAMAVALRVGGDVPASRGVVQEMWSNLDFKVGWFELQAAVEALAVAWEEIEKEVEV